MTTNLKNLPKPEPHTDDYLPISAIEACEKTKTYVKVKDKEQLKEIFNKIRMQIVAGKYSFDIHEPLSPGNRQILKEYGYEIIDYQPYDGMSGISISWNKYRR
jgi:hypothetical protein